MGSECVCNSDITVWAGDTSEGMLVTLPADFSKDSSGAFIMPSYAVVQL